MKTRRKTAKAVKTSKARKRAKPATKKATKTVKTVKRTSTTKRTTKTAKRSRSVKLATKTAKRPRSTKRVTKSSVRRTKPRRTTRQIKVKEPTLLDRIASATDELQVLRSRLANAGDNLPAVGLHRIIALENELEKLWELRRREQAAPLRQTALTEEEEKELAFPSGSRVRG